MKSFRQLLLLLICTFTLIINSNAQGGPCNTNSCSVCDVSATITSISGGIINNNISNINGSSAPGSTESSNSPLAITATECGVITIDVELDFNWHQGENINWIHGISFENSNGWLAAEGTIIPPNPGWLFMNSITGVCSSTTYDAGYYWDPPGIDCGDSGNYSNYNGNNCNNNNGDLCEGENAALVDGDPSDNWGIDCENDCPQFGFSLTYCPTESGTTDEVITFILTEDGETGGWNQSDGCIFTLSFPIKINAAGVQLPDEDIGPICQDSCVTIDAGNGCDSYIWSNGETTPEITVCPSETTTYSVTVSSDIGCETSGDVTVLVEPCCDANAGIIAANSMTLCPGESSNISVIDYQDESQYTQVLIIVNENGLIEEIINQDNYTLTSDICATYTVYSYNYLISGGSTVPQIGNNISSINCANHCCELVEIVVSFEDDIAPIFNNQPQNITYSCIDDLPAMPILDWSDNCISSGSSIGEESQIYTFCDGGEITRTWIAIDDCDNETSYTQTITVLPMVAPQFVNTPADESIGCSIPIPLGSDLNYTNGQSGTCLIVGSVSPTIIADTSFCGGTITYNWEFSDDCENTISYTQVITLSGPPAPNFVNPPSNITIDCGDDIPPAIDIVVSNNVLGRCQIEELVSPTIEDQSSLCGGFVIYTWKYSDDCGNTINHTQTITINPAPEAVFIDPPQNITTSCIDIDQITLPSLSYTNSAPVPCLIQGEVVSVQTGDVNICGGTLENTWTFIDLCGREITHIQTVTIEPASIAVFLNIPSDITVTCDEFIDDIISLDYSNNENGSCSIDGSVDGILIGEPNTCGNIIERVWTFTDECNRTIMHTQNVEITSATPPSFLDLPSQSLTIECGNIPEPSILNYSNNQTENCEINGSQLGVITGSHDACGGTLLQTWLATDECGNTIEFLQTIEVQPADDPIWINLPIDMTIDCAEDFPAPPPLEYDNGAIDICSISGFADATVLEGPNQQEFNWSYTNECTGETIIHTQTISRPLAPEIEINNAVCSDDWSTYMVEITTNGNEVIPSEGTINTVNSSIVIIENISITNILQVSIIDPITGCTNEYFVNPPDCECPDVPAPISDGDQSICEGDNIPALLVTVASGSTVNWYDTQTGGTLLLEDSPSYTPAVFEPGIYTYYAEAINAEGCVSVTRTAVSLEILELPDAMNVSISQCANAEGNAIFDLSNINNQVNSNLSFTIQYYQSIEDAEINQNEITGTYSTSQVEVLLIAKVTSTNGCVSYATITLTSIELTTFDISTDCNDNGTNTDASDDFYIITIVSPNNGSTNGTFDVLIDGVFTTALPYGTGGEFQLDASNQSVEITVQDDSEIYCFAPQSIGPLFPCSSECSIGFEVNSLCDDGGSSGITSDDTYAITFIATGINNSNTGFILSVDGVDNGTYSYDVEHTIIVSADGAQHQLIVMDAETVTCVAAFDTESLNPCSGTCSIIAEVISSDCQNNDTNNDESDDTFSAIISAEILDGTGIYKIEPGNYTASSGTNIEIGPFNIADGNVIVTITDANISTCITTLTIEAPQPCSICNETVNAGSNGTLDCDITSIDLVGSSSIPGIGLWTGPGGIEFEGYEATVDIAGTYYFSVDFGQSCIVNDSLVIDVSKDIPMADAGENGMLTCAIDKVTLEGTVSGGSGNFQYTWYNENGDILGNGLTIKVTVAGNYFFEVKDLDTKCVSPQDVVSIIDKTGEPTAIIYANPGDILDCIIELIYITNEEEQDVVYTWTVNNQPFGASVMTINEPSNIELFALDTISGCEAYSSLNITSLEEYPLINMDTDEDLNCENTEITIYGYTPTPSENIEYTWYNQDNEIIATGIEEINVNETGTYYLELMDTAIGCSNRDTLTLEGIYNYPTLTAASDYTFGCVQGQLAINIGVNGNADDLNFKWTTETGTFAEISKDSIAIVTQAGEYIVTVLDQESQCGVSDTIIVFPPEEISGSEIEVIDENCDQNSDGVIILGDVIGGTGPYKYLFGDILQQDNIVDDLSAGIYSFIIIDSKGCKFDTLVEISVVEPFEVDLGTEITVQSGDNTSLTVQVNIPEEEIANVLWFPSTGLSCDTCVTTVLEGSIAAEEYEVTVTDIYGCNNTATVRVIREEKTVISFPNIISTNGDNTNNYFTAYSDDESATVLSMKIFDRWGALVWFRDEFSPNIPQDGWDGTFSGAHVEQGVYVFLVEMELAEGTQVFSGDITVIR